MDIARQFPKLVARAAIQKRIRQGDAKVALDYLRLRDKFYKEDASEEGSWAKLPTVQFISVASNEWADQQNNDWQMSTKQNSPYSTSSTSWEKMTPRENEEQVLRNIDLLSSSND